MTIIAAVLITAISGVSAHSWLECTNHDNTQIRGWMQGNSTLNPPVIIDPAMPWFSYLCSGWPRNKSNPGNWIDESSNYVWNIAANSWNGGSYHPPDTHACPPNQRSQTYHPNAPMPTTSPGSAIRLMFGGNGHSRGYDVGGDPGTVIVYWKGSPELEITDISEFTEENALQSQGFSADSFSYPADLSITSPPEGLVDKGNWMELKLPSTMAPGRHMMAWVWYYKNGTGIVAPEWSTCFDVMIQGSAAVPSPLESQEFPSPVSTPAITATANKVSFDSSASLFAVKPSDSTDKQQLAVSTTITSSTTLVSSSWLQIRPGRMWMWRILEGRPQENAENHRRRFVD